MEQIKLTKDEASHLWGFILAMVYLHPKQTIKDKGLMKILVKIKKQVPILKSIKELISK